ncbi:MAG: hypothetical protein ACD_13C00015G0033 [uncultured bacterium]|nr:MAG: hypothetical protein ACD_13C00015G0033 [uncultured bacterium]KKR52453.1 MAG: hypothetical protein UT88_C0023G0004 [Candidatus Woesebacteria bacterium GW2011_GWD2_40_19]KKR57038.1 MAG: hypothetical protein UT96_C0028G0018 [Candidatus Woesebacteria bacterium GW2011_GWC2_40_30]HAU65092.1 hypothetical protein [Candidatus Woesebacteria bacterium]HCC08927.1 hypothetical protein [Candidatus Woesebacteria bacterium]
MKTLGELEAEVNEIKKRNVKVETDKAWETSITRRLLLIVFTYLAIAIYLITSLVFHPPG